MLRTLPNIGAMRRATLYDMTKFDRSDARLLLALCETPRATGVQLAAALRMARNTVQSRLARWEDRRVLASMDRLISARDLGYALRAYISANVDQHRLEPIIIMLSDIPEVVEVTGLSGDGDLLIAVAAVDADDLWRLAGLILAIAPIENVTSVAGSGLDGVGIAGKLLAPWNTRLLSKRVD
jgi:DNA-binding Lrp family transcriptional regulator